jgi:hypothetical protein
MIKGIGNSQTATTAISPVWGKILITPNVQYNLLSESKLLETGWTVLRDTTNFTISIQKDEYNFTFCPTKGLWMINQTNKIKNKHTFPEGSWATKLFDPKNRDKIERIPYASRKNSLNINWHSIENKDMKRSWNTLNSSNTGNEASSSLCKLPNQFNQGTDSKEVTDGGPITYLSTKSWTNKEKEGIKTAINLHSYMGHPSDNVLITMIENSDKNRWPCTTTDIANMTKEFGKCEACVRAKYPQPTQITSSHPPTKTSGEVLHVDIVYFKNVGSYLLSSDEATGHLVAIQITDKTENTLTQTIERVVHVYKSYGLEVKKICSDREKGISKEQLQSIGIIHQTTDAQGHEHTIERNVRTLRNCIKSIIAGSMYGIPHSFMNDLITWAITSLNLRWNKKCSDGQSPIELITGKPFDYKAYINVSFAEVLIFHNTYTDSEQMKGTYGMVMGRDLDSPSVLKVLDLVTKQEVYRSNFVRVNPNPDIEKLCRAWAKQDPIQIDLIMSENYQQSPDTIEAPTKISKKPKAILEDENQEKEFQVTEAENSKGRYELRKNPQKASQLTQSTSKGWKKKVIDTLNSHDVNFVFYAFKKSVNHAYISFSAALKSNPSGTTEAVKRELMQMQQQRVFSPTYQKEVGSDAIISSMVVIQGEKARIVAGGHQQNPNIYKLHETAGPTVKVQTLFMLDAISVTEGLVISTCDITGAYLNAFLPDHTVIFMKLPKLVSDILIEMAPEYKKYITISGQLIVRLRKALYGLLESATLWNLNMCATLIELGYSQSKFDVCLFFKRKENISTYIGLYVDDLKIATNSETERIFLLDGLTKKYGKLKLKNGPYILYRGLEIEQSKDIIQIHQQTYINETLELLNIHQDSNSPCSRNLHEKEEDNAEPVDPHIFVSTLAKVSWIAHQTRFDLKYIVSHLSTKSQAPTVTDMHHLHKVLRYLHKTKNDKLTFTKSSLQISAFADASHLHSRDLMGQSGYVIQLGINTIICESQKQKLVSQSSMEAELISLNDSINWITWLRHIMEEVGYKQDNIPVYQDNLSTIQIVELGRLTQRTKHLNARQLLASQEVKEKNIHLLHLETEEMFADMLTKSMDPVLFQKFKKRLLNMQ